MSGMSSTRVDLLTAIIATCACLKCDCGITDKYTSKFTDQLSKKWYGQNRSSRSVYYGLAKVLKIKSLVAWSISQERMDQKQILNFVLPKYTHY